jgi:hypothetical protein
MKEKLEILRSIICRQLTVILIPLIVVSTVFDEVKYGQMSAKGSWDGVGALVSSGVADIDIGFYAVTKERSELVAFTDTLGYGR